MSHAIRFNALLFAGLVLITSALALGRARHFAARHDDPSALLEGQAAHAFETYYDKVFPVRNFGVSLWAAIDYTLFHEGRDGVVVGRDGWLYTDEEFKLPNNPQRHLSANLALINAADAQLSQRGIALLIAPVPAKARVYPEHLDGRRPPPLRQGLYTALHRFAQADGLADVDLLTPLMQGKLQALTYLRTDTHWTPWGAQLAAQAIAARVDEAGLGITRDRDYHTVDDGERTHTGDLLSFLPLAPYFSGLLPPPERIERRHTEAADADASGGLLGDAPLPQIALVGTSYSAEPQWNFVGALKQALHADVASYAKVGRGPFEPMLSYLHGEDLRKAPPKLVIWELPERYLPDDPGLDPDTAPAATPGNASTQSVHGGTIP